MRKIRNTQTKLNNEKYNQTKFNEKSKNNRKEHKKTAQLKMTGIYVPGLIHHPSFPYKEMENATKRHLLIVKSYVDFSNHTSII